ncbi:MAG: NADH-quinone oxidoreductase subunit NuoG [Thermomicrobiales bacterium]
MVQQATKDAAPPPPPNTVTLTIDDKEVVVPKGTLLVEAAKSVGIDIPVFCYEPRLAPVGACRMCLVEIEKMPRLQTACTTPVGDGMVVRTSAEKSRAAQSDVLGMLLANHPLDCPVCDKGGECPLQDTTFNYGPGVSKFYEPKRTFPKPIPLSSLIALDRERCIMCYRCVRFQREVAGDEALTVIDRGSHSEIAVTEGRDFDSIYSGNTIELCPVGALTSIPFRFRARPWDLTKVPSVCDKCSVGCNLNVEYRNNQVLRLTAHANPPVDEGWLCDRGRFTYDYVNSRERLTRPLVRRGVELVPASWDEALDTIARRFRETAQASGPNAVGGVISARATNEEMYLFGKLFRSLGTTALDHWPRSEPVIGPFGVDALHGSIEALDRIGTILLVGADPLNEQPVLNLRLRKAARRGARLIVVGPEPNDLDNVATKVVRAPHAALPTLLATWANLLLTENMQNAEFVTGRTARLDRARTGLAPFTVQRAASETGLPAADIDAVGRLIAEKAPHALLFRRDLASGTPDDPYLDALTDLALLLGATGEDGIFGGLVGEANSQGAIDLNILPSGPGGVPVLQAQQLKALYLLGVDPDGRGETANALEEIEFLVVQDMFLTDTARRAHVVLPAVSWAEKDGTFTNLERRVQRLRPAVRPPGEARPDWRVLRDLGKRLAPDGGYAFTSPVSIWQELAAAVPAYGALTYSKLAKGGQQWSLPHVGDGNGGGRFQFRSGGER